MNDVRDSHAYLVIRAAMQRFRSFQYRYVLDAVRERRGPDLGILRMFVALDGRCGAGKTTLAEALAEDLNREAGGRPVCAVVHMDDFFLRPEQRTPERLAVPGGNVDYERFRAEVLEPLCAGGAACYRPFDCHTGALGEAVTVDPTMYVLVEGSYACHPTLRDYYHERFFLTLSPEEQWRRIVARNGEAGAAAFRERWIPLEEAYFEGCRVREVCQLVDASK